MCFEPNESLLLNASSQKSLFHSNLVIYIRRDKHGKMHFLRVEVVLQAATYFVVFTDADTMPPPVRINNFSQVAIQFYQVKGSLVNYY